MGIIKDSQSPQNIKFALSVQFLGKEVGDEGFLHADKHQSFLQVQVLKSTCRKLWCLSACKKPSSPTSFLRNCKDRANLIFWKLWESLIIPINNYTSHLQETSMLICMLKSNVGIKVFYVVILSLLMGMIKHSQSTQTNKLQYLYNISKNKLGMHFIFCMQINSQTCPKYPK